MVVVVVVVILEGMGEGGRRGGGEGVEQQDVARGRLVCAAGVGVWVFGRWGWGVGVRALAAGEVLVLVLVFRASGRALRVDPVLFPALRLEPLEGRRAAATEGVPASRKVVLFAGWEASLGSTV